MGKNIKNIFSVCTEESEVILHSNSTETPMMEAPSKFNFIMKKIIQKKFTVTQAIFPSMLALCWTVPVRSRQAFFSSKSLDLPNSLHAHWAFPQMAIGWELCNTVILHARKSNWISTMIQIRCEILNKIFYNFKKKLKHFINSLMY